MKQSDGIISKAALIEEGESKRDARSKKQEKEEMKKGKLKVTSSSL